LHHGDFSVHCHVFVYDPVNHGYESHKSQAADLYKQDNNYLTERRPVRARIVRHEARYASGAGGGKKCVKIRRLFRRSKRQRQQQATYDDNQKISYGQALPDGQFNFKSFAVHFRPCNNFASL